MHRDCPDTCRLLRVDWTCLQKCVTRAFTKISRCFLGLGCYRMHMLENRASQPCADVANICLFLREDVVLCKHLCANSIPGSWWSNVVLEKTALEFTQRLLSKRLSPSLMQSRYEESTDMKKLVAPLSFFKTFPCIILPFACSCNDGLF